MVNETREFIEIVVDYFTAIEAACVNAKKQAMDLIEPEKPTQGSTKLPFDANKIKWEDRVNENGKFQKTTDFGNPDYNALLEFLKTLAGGSIPSDDYGYWIYPDGFTIGRRLRR